MPQMSEIFRLFESASLSQCRDIAAHLGSRLYVLEKRHSGMKRANINEAAGLSADMVLNLSRAVHMDEEEPCNCGRCDDCVAARSDEHYDRSA